LRFLLIGFGPPLDGAKFGEGYPVLDAFGSPRVQLPSACISKIKDALLPPGNLRFRP
jgi:hypothetical protein